MKVNLINDNYLITTKLNRNIKVRDLLYSLRNNDSFKSQFNAGDLLLIESGINFMNEDDYIKFSENTEKDFYLINRQTYKKNKNLNIDIGDAIMKVTEGKTKIKPTSKKLSSADKMQERLQLIQQMTESLGVLQTNNPILQNRVGEINHFRDILRSMMLELPNRIQPQSQEIVSPNENMLAQLVDMGFPEESCRRALIISRNNVSRATDLLINDELDYGNNDM